MASALQSIIKDGQYWHASFMIPLNKPSGKKKKNQGIFLPLLNTKALSTSKYKQDTTMKEEMTVLSTSQSGVS